MNLNPCFLWQRARKPWNLTPEERKPFWDYAKANYFDRGVDFRTAVEDMVAKTGHPADFWYEVIAGPKTHRIKTNEMYRKEQARSSAIAKAQQHLDNIDTHPAVKIFKAATAVPRAALTFGHGVVFPVTHGGGLMLRPTAWKSFADGWWRSMKAISNDTYLAMGRELTGHPEYALGRKSGLKINPDEGPQGMLTGWITSKPGWSRRAWLGLQWMRFNLWHSSMEPYLKQFKAGEIKQAELEDIGKSMAEIANHATGVTSYRMGGVGKAMFAPQLTASKFARAFIDPVKTLGTFARMSTGMGKAVSAGEKAAAYKRLFNATEFVAASYAGLQLNNALLSTFGSDQKINFTDVKKSDWLRFKTGDGHVLSSRGPEEMIRLIGDLVAIGYSSKKDLKGESQRQAAVDQISKFLQYKISPGVGMAAEMAYGRDVFGRPLPPEVQKARMALGLKPQKESKTKPQYSALEYASQHGPIFIGGGARDVFNSLRERGMSALDATALFRGALVSAGEYFGFGAYEETPPKVSYSAKGGAASRVKAHRAVLKGLVGENDE